MVSKIREELHRNHTSNSKIMGIEFAAGIVLFNPKDYQFIDSIKKLRKLGISVIIFDNSNVNDLQSKNEKSISIESFTSVSYLSSDGNIGLASAYNKIILEVKKSLITKGLFLFDQDTLINEKSVQILMNNFLSLEKKEIFGSVSGLPLRENGVPYRVQYWNKSEIVDNLVRVKQVPSSFSLININSFDKIGLFNEKYFIDNIDIDFSIRCNQAQLPVYLNTKAIFIHKVGIGDFSFFGKTLFPIPDAYRHYYQIRNLILCSRYNNIGIFRPIYLTIERLIIIFFIGIYKRDFIKRFNYALKGVIDGLKGVTGETIRS